MKTFSPYSSSRIKIPNKVEAYLSQQSRNCPNVKRRSRLLSLRLNLSPVPVLVVLLLWELLILVLCDHQRRNKCVSSRLQLAVSSDERRDGKRTGPIRLDPKHCVSICLPHFVSLDLQILQSPSQDLIDPLVIEAQFAWSGKKMKMRRVFRVGLIAGWKLLEVCLLFFSF